MAFATLTGKVLGMEMALQAAMAMLLISSIKDPLRAGEVGKMAAQMGDRLKAEVAKRMEQASALGPEVATVVQQEAQRAIDSCFSSSADLLDLVARVSLDMAAPESPTQN